MSQNKAIKLKVVRSHGKEITFNVACLSIRAVLQNNIDLSLPLFI